ncbi:MAG: hypothetical protein IPO77_09820 [Acidobacteria bacterium]|nr:hypothetical protein [Acidobacteriota bacterium]
MQYIFRFAMTFVLALAVAGIAAAQDPTKVKRPVKNPPQYPNIIDLENKEQQQQQDKEKAEKAEQQAAQDRQFQDALVQAVTSLTGELRMLSDEMRLINLRQQAQFDLMKITRVDARIEAYERELRSVRERIYANDTEEQRLYQMLTPESLQAQTTNAATFNRDQAIQQLKAALEARIRAIVTEKERLRAIEADLVSAMSLYQNVAGEAEKRIDAAEEKLRQIESLLQAKKDKIPASDKKPK